MSYIDKVEGCGEIVHSIARKEFFKVIESVISRLRKADLDTKSSEICHLIDALYWSYKSSDLPALARLQVFRVLQDGNGQRFNKLRLSWGLTLEENANGNKKSKDKTASLPDKIMHAFQFMFKSVLSCIVSEDTAFGISESDFSMHQSVVNIK